jgi:hypothetical protein
VKVVTAAEEWMRWNHSDLKLYLRALVFFAKKDFAANVSAKLINEFVFQKMK